MFQQNRARAKRAVHRPSRARRDVFRATGGGVMITIVMLVVDFPACSALPRERRHERHVARRARRDRAYFPKSLVLPEFYSTHKPIAYRMGGSSRRVNSSQ